MTNEQIASKLWDNGFDIRRHYYDGILVSLTTRKINIFEVREALDFEVPGEMFERWGDKVMVRGIDS